MPKGTLDPRRPSDNPNDGPGAANGLPAFEPFLNAGNTIFQSWLAVGTELMEFSRDRLTDSIQLSNAIKDTTNLTEAVELQAQFVQSTMSDCLIEATKLAGMSARTLLDGFAAMRTRERTTIPPPPTD